jgi:hypothetical protein
VTPLPTGRLTTEKTGDTVAVDLSVGQVTLMPDTIQVVRDALVKSHKENPPRLYSGVVEG